MFQLSFLMTNRVSHFSSESCLALVMPNGPANPRRPTRSVRCAARLSTFVLVSSTTLPTWNRAWHLLCQMGRPTPADQRAAYGAPRVFQLSFSFRRPLCRRGIVLTFPFVKRRNRHSSRAPPPHLSYPCCKPTTPPRTFGAFSERIGRRLRRNGVCVCGSASDMHPRSFVRLESCCTGRRVSPLAASSVLDQRTGLPL